MLEAVTQPPNLHTAFLRVEASQGMSGVDGVTIGEFRHNLEVNLAVLGEELRTGCYFPLPLLRFLVAKADGSPRALSVPTVRDRVAQAAVLNFIEPIFETQFEEVSFAYRRGRSVRQAAMRIKALRDRGYRHIADVDIDDYFNQIDHELLFAKIAAVVTDAAILALLRRWVRAEIYEGEQIFALGKGIPQGAVISPLLANLFLDELDEALLARGYQVVRYADDFIVLTKTPQAAQTALRDIGDILARLHLAVDAEDSGLGNFEQGFKYLGLIFLKDSILAPFDRPRKAKRVLFMPPPFDLAGYLAARQTRGD